MKFLNVIFLFVFLFVSFTAFSNSETKTLYRSGLAALKDYFKTGKITKFDIAVAKFRLLKLKDPKNDNAELMLGILYTAQGQKIAETLSKKNFKRKSTYFQIGNLFLMQNKFKEAIKCYELCTKAYPKWKCPLRHKGEAELKAGMIDNSIKTLYKCIKLDKKHFDAWVFLADALIQAKRYNEAEKALDNSIKQIKNNSEMEEETTIKDSYKLYIKLYEKTGNTEKLNYYKDLLK